jgi:hypothetical protein
VAHLLANGDEQAELILSVEKSRNSGDDARKQAYIAEAARADAETKRRYFEQYLSQANVPEDWAQESLANFNSPNQSNLTLPYLKLALAQLPKIQQTRKIFFTTAWLKAFIGSHQTSAALAVVRRFLASSRLEENLKLKILEISDDLERAVILRRKFGNE